MQIQRALISVSDKTGIKEFAKNFPKILKFYQPAAAKVLKEGRHKSY